MREICFFILFWVFGLQLKAQTELLFNKNWEFVKDIDTSQTKKILFEENTTIGWKKVTLPHTANIEPLVTTQKQWQGTCFYRKFFDVEEKNIGKHIALKFEAAMQVADIYVNGEYIQKHNGGYLPFIVDVSKKVKKGRNCILVKLNNEDNPLVPPGKTLSTLDFNYYSGIYRNVYLQVKDNIYISDAVQANRTAAGGVFVSYENISQTSATVNVQVDIQNDNSTEQTISLQTYLTDKKGKVVATWQSKLVKLQPSSNTIVASKLEVKNPELWSPNAPNLYTLKVSLQKAKTKIEEQSQKIGIRQFTIDANKLFINGQKFVMRGTNRHQEYPYIGYALSDNAQYRDAWNIRQAGFNFVRCSHYPQSPAFLNACDELGILVMNSTPGWQFFGNEEFKKNSLQNVRDMVHRDRNHPSIVLWEASINETEMPKDYMQKAHNIVHEELPFAGIYTCGWIDDVYDVFIPARQHAKAPDYWKKYQKNKPIFIAEYGDWEYYAQNAGFNQTAFGDLKGEEKNSRQLRGFGQIRLAQQALNYQEAHNDNLNASNFLGDANWLMYDYNRGYSPDIESSGIMDITRLPKFAFYFYKSLDNPNSHSNKEFTKPMLFIANYWNNPNYKTVTVYSNCEEVELFLNSKSIAKQKPDINQYSNNLQHAPFTFAISEYQAGKLEAKGYIGNKEIISAQQTTPQTPTAIRLEADYSGKPLQADCNDILFIRANIVDENGTINPDATDAINFTIEGNAELVGENPVKAEAGIATILVKAGEKKGKITIKATNAKLKEGSLMIND